MDKQQLDHYIQKMNLAKNLTGSICNIFLFAAAFVLMPIAAHADIVFPSVVQWLSAAGPYSIFLLPAFITVPLLLAISIIEALIVRAILKPTASVGRLIFNLFAVNTFTSAIGLVVMPNGTELSQGLPLAFLATTIIECPCLVFIYPKGKRRFSFALLKASALMNFASYAFLGAILLLLIYLPSRLMPNDLDKHKLSGQLLLTDYHDIVQITADIPSGKITKYPGTSVREEKSVYRIAFIGGKRYLYNTHTGLRMTVIPGGPYLDRWQISDNGRFYANYLLGTDVVVVGDVQMKTQKRFKHIDEFALCSRTGKIALASNKKLIIYDPTKCTSNYFRLRGAPDSYDDAVEWSPDGKYVAYAAIVSPYTQMVGEISPDAIRVVALDGKQATVFRDLPLSVQWDDLLWLPDAK